MGDRTPALDTNNSWPSWSKLSTFSASWFCICEMGAYILVLLGELNKIVCGELRHCLTLEVISFLQSPPRRGPPGVKRGEAQAAFC